MAAIMKNRTDNDIKNKWNSMQRKLQRLAMLPLVPATLPPSSDEQSSTRPPEPPALSELEEQSSTRPPLENDPLFISQLPEAQTFYDEHTKVAYSVSYDADQFLDHDGQCAQV